MKYLESQMHENLNIFFTNGTTVRLKKHTLIKKIISVIRG